MAHQTVCMLLPDDGRAHLSAIIRDRSRPFKHIQRGVFTCLVDRQACRSRWIAKVNENPRPLVRTNPAQAVLNKLNWCRAPLV